MMWKLLIGTSWLLLTLSAIAETAEPTHVAVVRFAAEHRRCLIHSFVESVRAAHEFDPGLLDRSLASCEPSLQAWKVKLPSNDEPAGERTLTEVRKASKRAVAAAVLLYLGRQP
jgi:hypothetical protein